MDSLRLLQRHAGRRPPLRLHRLRARPHRPAAHRRPHAERARGGVRNQLPSSRWYSGSGIYRARAAGRHRPGPRRAPGHVRDHAGPGEHDRVTATPTCTSRTQRRQRPAATDAERRLPRVDGPARPHGRARPRRLAVTRPAPRQTDVDVRPHPHLWSTDRPRPLHAAAPRSRRRPRPSTRASTTFGMRYFRFDPDHGLHLNGEHLKIYGVDLHHDQGALGSAINYDALRRQMTHHEVDGRQRASAPRTTRPRRR